MMELRPLAIYPYPPAPEVLEAIKRAKAAMNLSFLVAPCEAVIGGPVRVRATVPPPFMADYALSLQPENSASLQAALRWVLDENSTDSRAVLKHQWLAQTLGVEIVEVFE